MLDAVATNIEIRLRDAKFIRTRSTHILTLFSFRLITGGMALESKATTLDGSRPRESRQRNQRLQN